MSEREIKKFEKEFDKDGDGTIDIEEFFEMVQTIEVFELFGSM